MAIQDVAASPITAGTGSVTLTVASVIAVAASPVTVAVGTVKLSTSQTVSVAASPLTIAQGNMTLSTSAVMQVAAAPITYGTCRVNLTGASDTRGMSVCEVVNDLLALWGIFCRKTAPPFALARALSDLNTALQTMWNCSAERSYWSSSKLDITVTANTDSANLPDNIQNVIGPCRVKSTLQPLSPLGTIGEFESFADLYLDGQTASRSLAYYIDRSNQDATDPAKLVLRVAPTSNAQQMFTLEVVTEPPRFTVADLYACPLLPIPHQYVETLLLPLARYFASGFEMFTAKDQKESIDRNYLIAKQALGLADPLPGKAGDNFNRREDTPTK